MGLLCKQITTYSHFMSEPFEYARLQAACKWASVPKNYQIIEKIVKNHM